MNEVISLWKKLLEATELKGKRRCLPGLGEECWGIPCPFPVKCRDVHQPSKVVPETVGMRAQLPPGSDLPSILDASLTWGGCG